MLIPRNWCIDSQKFKIVHPTEWGWVITVDVGGRGYRDSSVYTVGRVSGYDETRVVEPTEYVERNDQDPKRFGQEVHQRALDLPNVTIAVDSDGPGLATAIELEDLGHDVVRIHWDRPPHSDKDKNRYQDQRAFACAQARQAVFEGRLKLVPGSKIVEQASKIPYSFDRRGRFVIMPKQQMASEGIRSPDIFDTHCFFYLCDYVPVPGGGNTGRMKGIEIIAAKDISERYGCPMVVIFGLDKAGTQHVTTYGQTVSNSRCAAAAGNALKRHLEWPEGLCNAKPVDRICGNCRFFKPDYGPFSATSSSPEGTMGVGASNGSRGECAVEPLKIRRLIGCRHFEGKDWPQKVQRHHRSVACRLFGRFFEGKGWD